MSRAGPVVWWFLSRVPKKHILVAAAQVTVISGIFLAFAGDGLRAYFTPDDMMNLYQAYFRPLLDADRPLVNLVYRILFGVFGMHPLPFRVACFLLLGANLVLLYGVCLRLSGSSEVAALACLLGAYHAHLADLYYSSGTMYDLLCATLYFAAFLIYARSREDGRMPSWRARLTVWILFALALLAKEMALTLPALLLCFDLLYHPPRRHGVSVWGWMAREASLLWAPVMLASAVVAVKTTGAARMVNNPAYRPEFSARAFMEAWRHYATDLFYGVRFTDGRVIVLLLGTLAVALAWRKRELLFAWIVMVVGLLPVAFITPRGFFVVYLTLPGWYLFGATVLVSASATVWRGSAVRPLVLFALVAAVLIPAHLRQKPLGNAWVAEAHAAVRDVETRLDAVVGALPRGARVLFLSDPYPEEDWILTFIFGLHYGDDSLRVDRVRTMKAPPSAEELAGYARVLRMDGGVLRVE